jgi:hypothetical protein
MRAGSPACADPGAGARGQQPPGSAGPDSRVLMGRMSTARCIRAQ